MKKLLQEKGLWDLPIGYHNESKEMVALGNIADPLNALQSIRSLDQSQRENLVIERWRAGGWSDLISDDESITVNRAIKEVQENTEYGQDLVKLHIRAIEMLLEDLTA
ncbi:MULTISPECIES: hypothetical protein [Cyanophyceae]|uniref:Uncharacterized protein n=1 Tax=Stenomitos frigidus AS-A4 TaxID=2933935 RepID=A0ABV0KPP8_9CYAN|nr:hypothetical protein [Phormidium sp. FACHB-592]